MSTIRRRPWPAVALPTLLLSALLAVSGCGVPRDGTTRQVPDDRVPYRLLSPSSAAQPTERPDGPLVSVPHVFFSDAQDRLVPESLPVDAAGLSQVVSSVLRALASGPTEKQRSRGLGSALGPGARVRLLSIQHGAAEISVTPSAKDPSADRLPLAVGQIVLSVTSVAGVDEVRLFQDGDRVQAPLPGGEQTSDALDAADYASLIADGAERPVKAEPAPARTAD